MLEMIETASTQLTLTTPENRFEADSPHAASLPGGARQGSWLKVAKVAMQYGFSFGGTSLDMVGGDKCLCR